MKLRRLTIRRMPGFEDRGLDPGELSDQLNVIIGPNGSGKTTCCRAIRGLLWPATLAETRPADIVGQWDDQGAALRLEVQAGRGTCQRDGADADWPDLPPDHLAKCFTITIDDLFEDKGTEHDLAARLWREMAGGYDLHALRDADWVRLKSTHGRKELDEFKAARQQAQEIGAQQQALQDEEARLEQYRRQKQQALAARERLARLKVAEELLELGGQADAAGRAVEAFGQGMERLLGNEGESLSQLRTEIRQWQDRLEKAVDDHAAARRQREGAGLGERVIEEADLAEQAARLRRLDKLESDVAASATRLGEADGGLASALSALGPHASEDKLAGLDTVKLDAVAKLHRQGEDLAAQRSALTAQLAALAEPATVASADSLVQATSLLSQWLATPSQTPAEKGPDRFIGLGLAAVLAMAGAVFAIAASPWWALLLLPAVAGGLLLARDRRVSHASQAVVQEQFSRLGIAGPAAWTPDAAAARVGELHADLSAARQAEFVRRQRQELRRQLDALHAAAGELAVRHQAACAAAGATPETGGTALTVLAANLVAACKARLARDECRGAHRHVQEAFGEQFAAANAALTKHGLPPAADMPALHAAWDSLSRRAAEHREAARAMADAETRQREATGQLDSLRERKRKLFLEAELTDDADQELLRRIQRLQEYRAARRRLDDLAVRRDDLERKLADEPALKYAAAELIAAQRAALLEQADSYEDLVQRTGEIQRQIEAAGRGHQLEDAAGDLAAAQQRLDARRRQAEHAAAATMLLDEIEQEHRTEGQPAVMKQAGRWFTQFTRGRYQLQLDNAEAGSAGFRAIDNSSAALGAGLALSELSRGTYMQLLLAVRMAFAAAAERAGRTLPFVLDEVLSSSDPARFRAVIECLLALVRQGRQVFYFTCQPGDAAAWQQVAEESATAGARRIDLAEGAAEGAGASRLLTASTAQAPALPRPDARGLAEYAAALCVPPLDPAAGSAGAHLAHFVDDAEQLYRLLSAGVATCGQLRCLAAHGGAAALVQPLALQRIEARAAILDAFAIGRRIGRGKKLTAESLGDALAAAGVRSERLLEQTAAEAATAGWDASQLVDALRAQRIKGFRAAALEAMVDKLTETGHLDPRTRLTTDELRARALAAAGPFLSSDAISIDEVGRLCHTYASQPD